MHSLTVDHAHAVVRIRLQNSRILVNMSGVTSQNGPKQSKAYAWEGLTARQNTHLDKPLTADGCDLAHDGDLVWGLEQPHALQHPLQRLHIAPPCKEEKGGSQNFHSWCLSRERRLGRKFGSSAVVLRSLGKKSWSQNLDSSRLSHERRLSRTTESESSVFAAQWSACSTAT